MSRTIQHTPKETLAKVLDLAECCLDRASALMTRGNPFRAAHWQFWRQRVLAYGVGHEVLCEYCGAPCTMTLDYHESTGDLWMDLDRIENKSYRCLNLGPLAFAEDRVPALLLAEYHDLCDRYEARKSDDPEYVAELKADRRLEDLRQ